MNSKHVGESGLTLVELFVGLALTMIVIAGVHHLFVSQTRAYSVSSQVLDMQGIARFALNHVVRDLQMAGYDPQASNLFGITAYQNSNFTPSDDPALSLSINTQLYFTVDRDGDAAIDNDGSERIGFRVNAGWLETAVISNLDGSIASWQPVMENIESMTVSYTYADGNTSTAVGLPDNSVTGRNFGDVRGVTVSLRARANLPDPTYVDQTFGDSYRRITLAGKVVPRNLGF
jgi:Tfp pilus assembly protein PilW